MSKIIIEDIWIEDLFKWFYETVCNDGGDGAAAIVCKNYKEVANLFIEWWKKEYLESMKNRGYKLDTFPLEKFENNNMINYHDNNENFIFTNDPNIKLWPREYVYIIKEKCVMANGFSDKDGVIEPV